MKLTNDEKIYLQAKKLYYEGNPIMSDFEFDELENRLRDLDSDVIEIVGSHNLNDLKFAHLSPMLSLSKTQVTNEDVIEIPMDAVINWWNKHTDNSHEDSIMEYSPKFDGSSANLIFENGKLKLAITRGNKILGQDITNKLKLIVPNTINLNGKVEIRGEVVIKIPLFNEKYSHLYKNPRNFVAGILGRDDEFEDIVKDFTFVPFEIRIHSESSFEFHPNTFQFLKDSGFEVPFIVEDKISNFIDVYFKMKDYRLNKSPYLLDGFVIKFNVDSRYRIGETKHSPSWAKAIKFPPKEAITYIRNISWGLGLSGEFTPVAHLDPTDLDGTTVSNVSLYNFGNVNKNQLLPGAKIILVKSGDIIPMVKKILEPSTENIFDHIPSECEFCESELEIQNEIHLCCPNPDCSEKKLNRLKRGIGVFDMKRIGGRTINKLFKAGITTIHDFFDNSKMNKENLIKSGEFKAGRQLDIIFEARSTHVEITLPRIITAMGFDNVGSSISQQVANFIYDDNPDFKGLSESLYLPLIDPESAERKLIQSFIDVIESNGLVVVVPEKPIITDETVLYEMTGSPKEFGFSKKSDFTDELKQAGWLHHKLNNDCNILVTDSLESSSSKMSKARKLGIEIITYDQVIERINAKK